MKYEYQFIENTNLAGETYSYILRSDNAFIPIDESNSDYQQYIIHTNGELLIEAQLTDAKVKKLTPDVWYDFPAPVEEVVLPVVEAPVVEAPVVETPVVEVPVEEVPVEETPVVELAAAE